MTEENEEKLRSGEGRKTPLTRGMRIYHAHLYSHFLEHVKWKLAHFLADYGGKRCSWPRHGRSARVRDVGLQPSLLGAATSDHTLRPSPSPG